MFPMTNERDGSVSFTDAASAVTGSLFCGVTGFIAAGTVIWATLSAFGAPLPVIGGAEAVALAGFAVLTGLLLRHALKLARSGWA
jgi:hypothetical protein